MSEEDSICGLMLVYVSGCGDDEECARAERLLCEGAPHVAAAYAEAVAVYHCVPMTLSHVAPPDHCRHTLLGRVTADVSNAVSTASASAFTTPLGPATGLAGPSAVMRLRWPIYVASGLAACLAVALTASLMNNRRLESGYRQMASTLAGSQDVLRSSHVSLASLTTAASPAPAGDDTRQSFGRVLFCPVTKHYQITVFNLRPLPAGRVYELWLITPDSRKVAAGVFDVDDHGTATVMAVPQQQVDVAALAAVTDEPAGGSTQPTTSPLLAGALASAR